MPIILLEEDGDYSLYESDLDSWVYSCSRVLINGPPLSGKSTSLKTFPSPRHILVAPGELGASSIREDKNTKIYTFQFDPSQSTKYPQVWRAVQEVTKQILNEDFGKVETFGIDGLHKLYYFIQKALGYTPASDAREFSKYHETFINYLTPILGSGVNQVVATCYDGVETEEIKGMDGKAITSIYPQLPGKMAKEIMGMFPLVFHAERSGSGKEQEFKWRLRAKDRIQGAGAHFPPEIRDGFPAMVDQDWNFVLNLIKEQQKNEGRVAAAAAKPKESKIDASSNRKETNTRKASAKR